MSNPTTLPADWAPLREAAEVVARETHDAVFRYFAERGESCPTWGEVFPAGQAARIAAHATLLADLTRPASRDLWARWLAEKVGLAVGATAPRWRQSDARTGEVRWRLDVGGDVAGWVIFHDGPARFGAYQVVPGISTLTDPAAALCAALLAVVPHAE